MASTATTRRTQAERTAATQAALLDATIESLVELGYAGTTTTEIARRAGVSRGAQLHHVPTTQDLVVAAVEHLYERRFAEFRAAVTAVPSSADKIDAAIDVLWSFVSGPTFTACLEMTLAARTDDQLRPRVIELDDHFTEQVGQIFLEVFPEADGDPLWDVAPAFVFAVLEGLAVHTLLDNDPNDAVANVLGALKFLARLVPPDARRETP